ASMKEELTSLPLMMTPEQRAAIRTAAQPPKRWYEMFPSKWGLGLAAAAIVVLAVALPVFLKENPLLEPILAKLSTSPKAGEATATQPRLAENADSPAASPTATASAKPKDQNVRNEREEAAKSAALGDLKREAP